MLHYASSFLRSLRAMIRDKRKEYKYLPYLPYKRDINHVHVLICYNTSRFFMEVIVCVHIIIMLMGALIYGISTVLL